MIILKIFVEGIRKAVCSTAEFVNNIPAWVAKGRCTILYESEPEWLGWK